MTSDIAKALTLVAEELNKTATFYKDQPTVVEFAGHLAARLEMRADRESARSAGVDHFHPKVASADSLVAVGMIVDALQPATSTGAVEVRRLLSDRYDFESKLAAETAPGPAVPEPSGKPERHPNRREITDTMATNPEWRDPTPQHLDDPRFDAIWNVIKSWDINVPYVYAGYCGATGNHVRAILDALSTAQSANSGELSGCPFCGNGRITVCLHPTLDGSIDGVSVECADCTARVLALSEDQAIAAWNRRTPPLGGTAGEREQAFMTAPIDGCGYIDFSKAPPDQSVEHPLVKEWAHLQDRRLAFDFKEWGDHNGWINAVVTCGVCMAAELTRLHSPAPVSPKDKTP